MKRALSGLKTTMQRSPGAVPKVLRRHLASLMRRTDRRAKAVPAGPSSFGIPHNADWVWQPEALRSLLACPCDAGARNAAGLGTELSLFHDGSANEVLFGQAPGRGQDAAFPYCVDLELVGFSGTFLSLALDLPAEALRDLKARHVFRVDGELGIEIPCRFFLRLNIEHGPNTERFLCEAHMRDGRFSAAFDLVQMALNARRAEKAWLDLIFERPRAEAISLCALHLSRFPRAEV